MGHAYDTSRMQDVLIRYEADGRPQRPLAVPGTDHAGHRHAVRGRAAAGGRGQDQRGPRPRGASSQRVWKWKEESGGTIIRQLEAAGRLLRLGARAVHDGSGLSAAVREVFVRLWEEGLIYQDDYIVNWCPRCQTVLSDLEVEREERDGEFVYIKYGPLTLGDRAPGDEARRHRARRPSRGQALREVRGRRRSRCPSVEGTITHPGRRRRRGGSRSSAPGSSRSRPATTPSTSRSAGATTCPVRSVIGFDGKMTARPASTPGSTASSAGSASSEDMQALGLIERIEPYRHAVGVCYRCKTVVEPLVSKQWYVRVEAARRAGHQGGARRRRSRSCPRTGPRPTTTGWTNIRDWRISRQLWWGHRIPAWYCDAGRRRCTSRATDLTAVSDVRRPAPAGRRTCSTRGSRPALWPFSTLGWPDVHAGAQDVLSDLVPGHRLRHHLLLGRPDDDARPQVHGRRAVPPRLHPRPRARRRGAEDVEVEGQRRRPARRSWTVRDRTRSASRWRPSPARGATSASPRSASRATGTSPTSSGTRRALVLANLDGYDPRLARGDAHRGRPVDPSRARRRGRARSAAPLDAYRFNDAASARLPVPLARALRLVSGDREAKPLPEGRRGRRERSPSRRWWRRSTSRSGSCTRSCRSSPRTSGSGCPRGWGRLHHDRAASAELRASGRDAEAEAWMARRDRHRQRDPDHPQREPHFAGGGAGRSRAAPLGRTRRSSPSAAP